MSLASLILLSGCVASGGDLCRVSAPILIDDESAQCMTVETAQQILLHNETGERICGW